MEVQLFSPHKGQKQIINGFADSIHKFGIVATGRQFGKSLLAQNLMLYWLLQKPNQKGAWITPVYNQCKKIFSELTNAANQIIVKQNKADLTIEFINGSTLQFLSTDNYNTIRGFSFHYMVLDEAAFIKEDATLMEINPLVKTADGRVIALDGKVSLDDNAEFRQPDHAALVDHAATNPLEAKAKEIGRAHV